MATYPARYRLPVAYSTEIGRIITRWAFLESRLRDAAHKLVKVHPKIGRVAVREPRVVDHVTMIEDLARLRDIQLPVNWKQFRKMLQNLESVRDKIAHGLWLKHDKHRVPVLQQTKGSYVPSPGGQSVKARIDPLGVAVRLSDLQAITKDIERATRIASHICVLIDQRLPP